MSINIRPREAGNRTLWTLLCVLNAVSGPTTAEMGNGNGAFDMRTSRQKSAAAPQWAFQTIFERSGSTGTFKEFCRLLRKIIQANDLPEYLLCEEGGQSGPLLVMTHRDHADAELSPPAGV